MYLRLLRLLLPARFIYADDNLTFSARRLLARLAVAVLAVIVAALGLALLDDTSWREVLAGALLAWSVSLGVWAVASYRSGTDAVSAEVRRSAERDLLHARLNHLADRLGAPLVDIGGGGLDDTLRAREERIAHLAGLDELRPEDANARGYEFWNDVSLGWDSQGEPR